MFSQGYTPFRIYVTYKKPRHSGCAGRQLHEDLKETSGWRLGKERLEVFPVRTQKSTLEGRGDQKAPLRSPHPRQANRAEKRTAKATGPEAPRTRGHGAGAPLTPPLTRAHGPLGTSNHWAAPRTRGPPLPAGNCLFTQSLLPIILIMIDYATGSNIMQSNKRKVWKGSW